MNNITPFRSSPEQEFPEDIAMPELPGRLEHAVQQYKYEQSRCHPDSLNLPPVMTVTDQERSVVQNAITLIDAILRPASSLLLAKWLVWTDMLYAPPLGIEAARDKATAYAFAMKEPVPIGLLTRLNRIILTDLYKKWPAKAEITEFFAPRAREIKRTHSALTAIIEAQSEPPPEVIPQEVREAMSADCSRRVRAAITDKQATPTNKGAGVHGPWQGGSLVHAMPGEAAHRAKELSDGAVLALWEREVANGNQSARPRVDAYRKKMGLKDPSPDAL